MKIFGQLVVDVGGQLQTTAIVFCFIPKYIKRNPTSLFRIKKKNITPTTRHIIIRWNIMFCIPLHSNNQSDFQSHPIIKGVLFFMSMKQIRSKQTKQKQAIPPSPFSLKNKFSPSLPLDIVFLIAIFKVINTEDTFTETEQRHSHYITTVSLFHLFTFNESKFINIYSPWSMNPQTATVPVDQQNSPFNWSAWLTFIWWEMSTCQAFSESISPR